jgi:Skp family chaperone for outer membrane proteins
MNKIKFSFLMFLLLGFFATNAQDRQSRERVKDKINAQRVAYITNQLDLSEAESQKFWPVYNAYTAELEQLKSSLDIQFKRDLSDKEAEDMLTSMLDGRAKEIEIQKRYVQKLKSAIPAKKIVMLYRAEREFKEKLISGVRERRKERTKG